MTCGYSESPDRHSAFNKRLQKIRMHASPPPSPLPTAARRLQGERAAAKSLFWPRTRRNRLKRLIPAKGIQGNPAGGAPSRPPERPGAAANSFVKATANGVNSSGSFPGASCDHRPLCREGRWGGVGGPAGCSTSSRSRRAGPAWRRVARHGRTDRSRGPQGRTLSRLQGALARRPRLHRAARILLTPKTESVT